MEEDRKTPVVICVMCGRYTLATDLKKVADRFGRTDAR
jgi:hypothetical protein